MLMEPLPVHVLLDTVTASVPASFSESSPMRPFFSHNQCVRFIVLLRLANLRHLCCLDSVDVLRSEFLRHATMAHQDENEEATQDGAAQHNGDTNNGGFIVRESSKNKRAVSVTSPRVS